MALPLDHGIAMLSDQQREVHNLASLDGADLVKHANPAKPQNFCQQHGDENWT